MSNYTLTHLIDKLIRQMVDGHTLSTLTDGEITKLARYTQGNLIPFIVELESERDYLKL